MDLWDVAKLMAKRWYVALPVLVLTMVGAMVTARTVKPDYTATTNVSLLPPTKADEAGNGTGQTVNPWDANSLTVATLTYLNSKRLHDEMKAQGFSDVWEADIDERLRGLIVIQVTAPTPELSQATARKLQDLAAAEVARRQAVYNLEPGHQFTTIPFDDGDNIEVVTSKMKRALIVVVGVGVIITIGLTVSLDAFLRWRSRRREETSALRPTVVVGRKATANATGEKQQATAAPALAPAGADEPPDTQTQPLPTPPSAPTQAGTPTEEGKPVPIAQPMALRTLPAGVDGGEEETTRVVPAAGDPPADRRAGPSAGPGPWPIPVEPVLTANDTTVVLPLSSAQWMHQTRKSGDGRENGSR
jgi:capsular polysaccharide biosynthesis protein